MYEYTILMSLFVPLPIVFLVLSLGRAPYSPVTLPRPGRPRRLQDSYEIKKSTLILCLTSKTIVRTSNCICNIREDTLYKELCLTFLTSSDFSDNSFF